MDKVTNSIIQTAVVESIKKRQHVTNSKIAESIGVHPSYVQKVSRQERTLSERKFNELCKCWNVDIFDITNRLQMADVEYLQQKTIVKLMLARKIDYKELSKQTEISVLDLHQIMSEKRRLTKEEIDKIAAFFQIDPRVIAEGRVHTVMKIIRICLESILFEPSGIDAVLDFIEEGI